MKNVNFSFNSIQQHEITFILPLFPLNFSIQIKIVNLGLHFPHYEQFIEINEQSALNFDLIQAVQCLLPAAEMRGGYVLQL